MLCPEPGFCQAGKPQHKVADRLRPDTQTIAHEACGA